MKIVNNFDLDLYDHSIDMMKEKFTEMALNQGWTPGNIMEVFHECWGDHKHFKNTLLKYCSHGTRIE